MSRIKIPELKQLGDDHGLSLLARHALGTDSFEKHPDLKEIGEKILTKCQGLPLAITVVGGLFRTKEQHHSRWGHILHNELWGLSGRILPALLLSYHYLPSHLKRCFAACAIFRKDCEFSKKELILLWMAMGLLRQSREMNCVEDFGAECFDDLLSRSFFQNSAGSELKFVMHHLIIDAAEFVAGEICYRWEDMLENTKISKRARYLSSVRHARDVFENFKDFNSVQRLRTFVCIESPLSGYLRDKVLVDVVPKFKFLRVLSLRYNYITKLPDNIGELKHLRHLDVSYSAIQVLPASICTLYNLLTLSVNGCSRLRNLPADIGNLINLRHLDNTSTCLEEMPRGICKLASLQTLPEFIVGKGSGLKLRELKDLMLQGSLSIYGLEDVMDSQDAGEASLKLKHHLDELVLFWKSDDEHHHDEELEFDVLDKLKPQRNLKKLIINGYRCSKISSWVGDPSFLELTEMCIVNCRNCTSLPPLWELPMLKHLAIRDMLELRSIGVQFDNDGRSSEVTSSSLETLSFERLPKWEEWSICRGGVESRSLFPRLRELTMRGCPKLARIPLMALPSLSRLGFVDYQGPVLESLYVTSLCSLIIRKAMGLSVGIWSMSSLNNQKFANLGSLSIYECDGLESFPETGWAATSKLRSLTIRNCQNFKTMRFNQIQRNHRVSLEKLEIMSCPKLETFPDGDLPPNLTSFRVTYCCGKLLKPLSEWGLHRLASLEELFVSNYGCDGDDQQFLFPPTLTELVIEGLRNMESLSNGIQNLIKNFSSLKKLTIVDCLELRSFPKEVVLSNLSELTIHNCLILEKRIRYEGYYQSILASIPSVKYFSHEFARRYWYPSFY